jgi:hypothetical protein
MSILAGNYVCKENGVRLTLEETGDNNLSCCIDFQKATSVPEPLKGETLKGSGVYFNTGLFNICLTSSTISEKITLTSGWSGYQIKEEPLQLKLGCVATKLNADKVECHVCMDDLVFEKFQAHTIFILVFLDTEYIVTNSGKGGTCNAPLPVKDPQKCIYMVADYTHEISGHGSAELNIRAHKGDDILWRALDISSRRYSPHLYQLIATSGDQNMENVRIDSTTAALARPATDHDNATDCTLKLSQIRIGQVSARVLYENSVAYHIRFMLVTPTGPGENDFEVIGHYSWDSCINLCEKS